MDYYRAHENNASLTCRYFGISRQILRLRSGQALLSMEATVQSQGSEELGREESQASPPTAAHLVPETGSSGVAPKGAVSQVGKRQAGGATEAEGVAGIHLHGGTDLAQLKLRGVLKELPRTGISTRKRRWQRPYAVRKPKGYEIKRPGDVVQVDTLDVRPLPGVVLKHFTARDMVSRWDVVEAHTRATATTAAGFLERLLQRMPFPVRAIQVDGGSEYQAAFEESCEQRGLKLFVLPPRSPKLNGCVERAQRTHTEEFYEVTNFSLDVASLNRELLAWENIYNTIRPHQALGYLTPLAFWKRWQEEHPPDKENGTPDKAPNIPSAPCNSSVPYSNQKEVKCH